MSHTSLPSVSQLRIRIQCKFKTNVTAFKTNLYELKVLGVL